MSEGPSRNPAWARRVASLAAVSGALWLVLGACVSPSDGYDDYLNRTAASRGPVRQVSDAGPMEASLPDGGFTALYVSTCLPHITAVGNALKFQNSVTFTPSATGPGGTITITFIPLDKTSTTARTTVGTPIGPATSPVDAAGHFSLHLQNIVIPAAANPISPADATFAPDTTLPGTFSSASKFCGGLDGSVVAPISFPFDHCDDVCIFDRLDSLDAPLPVYTDRAAFVCPAPDCP